jgi:hypothetical protein
MHLLAVKSPANLKKMKVEDQPCENGGSMFVKATTQVPLPTNLLALHAKSGSAFVANQRNQALARFFFATDSFNH